MNLSSLIDKNLVFLDKDFETYEQIISFITDEIAKYTSVNPQQIKDALMKRESLGSTFLGHRLVLPHGYIDSIQDIALLFIRLHQPISVHIENRKELVKYVFAILTSQEKVQLYLKILSSIAQVITHMAYILDAATSPQQLISMLQQKEVTIEEYVTARDLISFTNAVPENATVANAVDIMKHIKVAFLPVVDANGKVKGIIDLPDLFIATFPAITQDAQSISSLEHIKDSGDMYLEPIKHFWDNEEKRSVTPFIRPLEHRVVYSTSSYTDVVRLMTQYHYHYIIVASNDMTLLGTIDTSDLIHKMIRI